MQHTDKYSPKFKGQVYYRITGPNGIIEEKTIDNAINANAKTIIVKALAGTLNGLGNINALKASILLASGVIQSVVVVGIDSIRISAEFDEASFNDTVDELQLLADPISGGLFSDVTGTSITKDNLSRLYIQWTIKLIDN